MIEKDPIDSHTDKKKGLTIVRPTENVEISTKKVQKNIHEIIDNREETDWEIMKTNKKCPDVGTTKKHFLRISHPLIDILGDDFEAIYAQNPLSIRENFRAAPAIIFCKRQGLPENFFKLLLEPSMLAHGFFTGEKERLIQLIDVIKTYESNSMIAWQVPEIKYDLIACLNPDYGNSMYTDEEFSDLLEKMKFPLKQ